MTKRLLAVLGVALLCVALLDGCDSGELTSDQKAQEYAERVDQATTFAELDELWGEELWYVTYPTRRQLVTKMAATASTFEQNLVTWRAARKLDVDSLEVQCRDRCVVQASTGDQIIAVLRETTQFDSTLVPRLADVATTFREWEFVVERTPADQLRLFGVSQMAELASGYNDWAFIQRYAEGTAWETSSLDSLVVHLPDDDYNYERAVDLLDRVVRLMRRDLQRRLELQILSRLQNTDQQTIVDVWQDAHRRDLRVQHSIADVLVRGRDLRWLIRAYTYAAHDPALVTQVFVAIDQRATSLRDWFYVENNAPKETLLHRVAILRIERLL